MDFGGHLHVTDHPLVAHKLAIIRNKNTEYQMFAQVVSEISMLLCYEATKDITLVASTVETPIATAEVKVIAKNKLAFVPILRAGLGMLDSVVRIMPAAKVGHIGLYRNPNTLEPVEYYCKLPQDIADRDVILLDPMVATGKSACIAISYLKDMGVENIKLVCLIASPEGVGHILENYPDVNIFSAALDQGLDENGYIVPGMGDAGDRIFGTK